MGKLCCFEKKVQGLRRDHHFPSRTVVLTIQSLVLERDAASLGDLQVHRLVRAFCSWRCHTENGLAPRSGRNKVGSATGRQTNSELGVAKTIVSFLV